MNAEVYDDSEQTLEELLQSGETEKYLLACGIEKDSIDDFAEACCKPDEDQRAQNVRNFLADEINLGRYQTIIFFMQALKKMFGAEFRKKFEYEVHLSYEAALNRSDNDAAKSIAEFCEANGIRYKQ
ncbi:MAG: hypothetical protein V1936_04010 [Patescibacteria group bacterium]